ncbi:MAG: imidazoleglycerol-phosphate dehydratase HisB [Acidimicrobiia bacterium]
MSRSARVERATRESKVVVSIDLDGSGRASVETGVGFFDHLLTSFAHHGLFDLEVRARGDLEVDDHHTVEDTALALGAAISQALGDRAGIARFGDAVVPMDEAIAHAAVDLSGRPYTVLAIELRTDRIGNLSTQNVSHILEALSRAGGLTLHLDSRGANDHHVAEAAIKALARALYKAVGIEQRRVGVPSTKGSL